jgi:hypothetical protein
MATDQIDGTKATPPVEYINILKMDAFLTKENVVERIEIIHNRAQSLKVFHIFKSHLTFAAIQAPNVSPEKSHLRRRNELARGFLQRERSRLLSGRK